MNSNTFFIVVTDSNYDLIIANLLYEFKTSSINAYECIIINTDAQTYFIIQNVSYELLMVMKQMLIRKHLEQKYIHSKSCNGLSNVQQFVRIHQNSFECNGIYVCILSFELLYSHQSAYEFAIVHADSHEVVESINILKLYLVFMNSMNSFLCCLIFFFEDVKN